MSEQRFGATGPARLARLLTDLGERGFLEGVAGGQPLAEAPTSRWRKLVKPREKVFTGVGPKIEALYRAGGWVLFTRPVLWFLAALIVSRAGDVRRADRRALRDAVRGREEVRPRAGSCSCSGASRSWPCTSSRTG